MPQLPMAFDSPPGPTTNIWKKEQKVEIRILAIEFMAIPITSIPDVGMADDGRLNVNCSFQIGLLGSFALPQPVFFFFTRLPLMIK
jgi:hypothetical protein